MGAIQDTAFIYLGMAPEFVRAAGDLLTGNREVIEEGENALSRTDLVHINVLLKENVFESREKSVTPKVSRLRSRLLSVIYPVLEGS